MALQLSPKNKIKADKKRPYQIDFTQFSKTFFCRFHTYYSITTGYLINNTKISSVIILLSNRTLSALKRPVYKEFQKILLFKLNCCRWFPRAIIQYSVHMLHFINNSACHFSKYFPRDLGCFGSHEVDGVYGS